MPISGSEIAKVQLREEAVSLNVANPFTYSSGIKSPIYCDNRVLIRSPATRNIIVEAFIEALSVNRLEFDVIAGTATAGIPWAAFIAQQLNLPMIYVRAAAKEHGKGNAIEGRIAAGEKALVIEDLISTGKSSLHVVQTLRDAGVIVDTCAAIFSYQFTEAQRLFEDGHCKVVTLCDLDSLLQTATELQLITEDERTSVLSWRSSPQDWYKTIQAASEVSAVTSPKAKV